LIGYAFPDGYKPETRKDDKSYKPKPMSSFSAGSQRPIYTQYLVFWEPLECTIEQILQQKLNLLEK